MDTREILKLYDEYERIHVDLADAIREDTGALVRFHYASPERHASVRYSRLTPNQVDEAIREQIAYFQGKAAAVCWVVCSHDPLCEQLAELLPAHGYEPDESSSIMVLDLAALPDSLNGLVEHDIRRMPSGDKLHDVGLVLNAAHEADYSHVTRLIAKELRETPERISVYTAYQDDQPVACGWVRFPPGKFASLWAGGTLHDYRKQGFYSALVAVRAQEARDRGYPYLMVDAGAMSQPIVARVGFQYLTTNTDYTYTYS